MEIAEIITTDGEVLTTENSLDKSIEFALLKKIDFNTIQEFYFNRVIISTVREKQLKSNNSNGATPINILDKLKWNYIEPYVELLIEKGYLQKRQSINSEVYFIKNKKTK